nr:HNH endonuclease signature motif containing protein [Sphingomonas sp. JUb134]
MAADRATIATVVDHIVPLAKGGSDEDENTRNLCDPCHQVVTAEQFGHQVARGARGVGRDGRPTNPEHPWRGAGARRPPRGGQSRAPVGRTPHGRSVCSETVSRVKSSGSGEGGDGDEAEDQSR